MQIYNQEYTREQIDTILNIIQDCVRNNRYIISLNENREENKEFITEYRIKKQMEIEILLGIVTDDFCHSLKNKKPGFEHENLYVFCPQMLLINSEATEEMVDIYVKFNIVNYGHNKHVITISFHKRNKPIKYLFR